MLNIFHVSCTIQKCDKFTDGTTIVTYDSILVVYARDEEHVRKLIMDWIDWDKSAKIETKKIDNTGLITEIGETVMMAYSNIISKKPA
jgi:hypothetical protein